MRWLVITPSDTDHTTLPLTPTLPLTLTLSRMFPFVYPGLSRFTPDPHAHVHAAKSRTNVQVAGIVAAGVGVTHRCGSGPLGLLPVYRGTWPRPTAPGLSPATARACQLTTGGGRHRQCLAAYCRLAAPAPDPLEESIRQPPRDLSRSPHTSPYAQDQTAGSHRDYHYDAQSVSQPAGQSVGQSVSQPASQPASSPRPLRRRLCGKSWPYFSSLPAASLISSAPHRSGLLMSGT